MQTAIQMTEAPPPCFGKSCDSKDTVCAGGADPAYSDVNTGSHIRPACDFYRSCLGKTAAAKMAPQQLLIPANNLLSHTAQPQPIVWSPGTTTQQPQNPQQTQQMIQQEAQRMAQQIAQHQRWAPPGQGYAPAQPQQVFTGGFQQMMPVNYGMPAYLTQPEEVGDSFWGALGRSLFRSVGKSLGHSISHFFDSTPLTGRQGQK